MGGQVGYSLTQRIYVMSGDIEKIEKLAVNPELFVDKGVIFDNSRMEFFSSNLDTIKKDRGQ